MQTETDAERIRALGGQNVEVFGNCKYDQAIEGLDADPAHWRRELGIDATVPVVVIGSTRSELEEKLIVEAIKGLQVQIVWAPRHLERVEALTAILNEAGSQVARRSLGGTLQSSRLGESPPPSTFSSAQERAPAVLILDTYGELSHVYSVADVVIIGGGFDNLGGQNLIQPLAHGKPVIHGPHMQNFKDVSEAADKDGAAVCVSSPGELKAVLSSLLADEGKRAQKGEAATRLVQASLGASKRYAQAIVAASGAS
jgi:3-deoxy-D-manno-octulosonic-acid transferase